MAQKPNAKYYSFCHHLFRVCVCVCVCVNYNGRLPTVGNDGLFVTVSLLFAGVPIYLSSKIEMSRSTELGRRTAPVFLARSGGWI